jgi:hypothetical protein
MKFTMNYNKSCKHGVNNCINDNDHKINTLKIRVVG